MDNQTARCCPTGHQYHAAVRVPDGAVVEWVNRDGGRGDLSGVTVAVKEIIELAEHERRTGTSLALDGRSIADAVAVQRLCAAGARVTARSVSHEFAWGITNRRADGLGTENPLLPGRVSGGSTGGSAALVASGAVDLGLGTDTAGSTRIPPAFCGVFGWKASNGLVPMDGCLPLAPRFDCIGLIARSAVLLGLGASALGAPEPSAQLRQGGHPRVGMLDPVVWRIADASRRAAMELLSAEHRAVIVGGLPDPTAVFGTFSVLQAAEVLRAHRDVIGLWPRRAPDYPDFVAERLRAVEALSPTRLAAAEGEAEQLQRNLAEVWCSVDVVVSVLPCGPSTVAAPDVIDTEDGSRPLREVLVPWTCLANLTGCPAVVAPMGVDASGAPIAVQLMSAPGTDRWLLDLLANWFPRAVPPLWP